MLFFFFFFFYFWHLNVFSYVYIQNFFNNILLKIFFFIFSALFLGSLWAYQEISWGGWWNWDMVEIINFFFFFLLLFFLHILKLNKKKIFFFNFLFLYFIFLFFFCLIRYNIIFSIHSFVLNNHYFFYLYMFIFFC